MSICNQNWKKTHTVLTAIFWANLHKVIAHSVTLTSGWGQNPQFAALLCIAKLLRPSFNLLLQLQQWTWSKLWSNIYKVVQLHKPSNAIRYYSLYPPTNISYMARGFRPMNNHKKRFLWATVAFVCRHVKMCVHVRCLIYVSVRSSAVYCQITAALVQLWFCVKQDIVVNQMKLQCLHSFGVRPHALLLTAMLPLPLIFN